MSDANRQKFEKWYKTQPNYHSGSFRRSIEVRFTYMEIVVEMAWESWQASRLTTPAPDGISQETWDGMSANDRGQFLRNIAYSKGWKAAAASPVSTGADAKDSEAALVGWAIYTNRKGPRAKNFNFATTYDEITAELHRQDGYKVLPLYTVPVGHLAARSLALEEAAAFVCPVPHVEEERRCEDLAKAIRDLKYKPRKTARNTGADAKDAASPQGARHEGGEREALRDMLDDARTNLDVLREMLGVPVEPHQTLFERMVDAAKHSAKLSAKAKFSPPAKTLLNACGAVPLCPTIGVAPTPPGYVLDDEQVQQIILDGEKSYRQHTHRGGVRGQQFTPQDYLYWHIVKAAERALRHLTAPPIAAMSDEAGKV